MSYRITPVRRINLVEVFLVRTFHEICRDYVRMFLHPISISLAESSCLVSNVWHVKIMM